MTDDTLADGISLHPVGEIRVLLGTPHDLGETRDGHRRITPILGGRVSFPGLGLDAEILPGGADRQIVRSDDRGTTVDIDARYSARASSGDVIDIQAVGVRRMERDRTEFRVTLRFETSDPHLADLQNALYLADGVRDAEEVRHRVYRVR